MRNLTLAALILGGVPLAAMVVVAAAIPAPIAPFVDHLPGCKSGWRMDADIQRPVPPRFLYIPFQYVENAMSVPSRVLYQDGRLAAVVRRGESVKFDCFDIAVRETI